MYYLDENKSLDKTQDPIFCI